MMKRITLIIVCLSLGLFQINAKVWTVSNNPVDSAAAMYSNLQEAIDVAVAGDTIYVSGSSISYGNITINEHLVLVGAGYNPETQMELKSQIDQISLRVGMDGFGNPLSNPSGAKITGFQLGYIYVYDGDINNIILTRNKDVYLYINVSSVTLSGWEIYNNIIHYIYGRLNVQTPNWIISNNIVTNYFRNMFSPTVLISNNIFIKSSGEAFTSITNALISNNIFYGAGTGGCDYCTFNNNISIGSGTTEFLYAHNTGANNMESTNPLFTSVASTAYSYSDDYRLQGGSPGKNAGTDASDIGIYGGTYPFPLGGDSPYLTSATPDIPRISEMNIQNSVVPQDGTLQVQIKAQIQE